MDVAELSGSQGARTAGQVLGRAFLADPVWAWVLRGADRERRLQAFFTSWVGGALSRPGARCLTVGDGLATAVWLPPGGWRTGLGETARTAPAALRTLRPAGTVRALRLQSVVEGRHPQEPHWYLEALGAVPEAQGTGVGGRAVQPVLDLCDDAGLPAYLESSNPRNWSFYERLGFARREPLPVPAGCPVVLPMWRAPR